MQGHSQKYGQKHQTKELGEFHNHLHALTMILLIYKPNVPNLYTNLFFKDLFYFLAACKTIQYLATTIVVFASCFCFRHEAGIFFTFEQIVGPFSGEVHLRTKLRQEISPEEMVYRFAIVISPTFR